LAELECGFDDATEMGEHLVSVASMPPALSIPVLANPQAGAKHSDGDGGEKIFDPVVGQKISFEQSDPVEGYDDEAMTDKSHKLLSSRISAKIRMT